MAAIGKISIGDCSQRRRGEPLWRGAGGDRGAQCAFGAAAVAHAHPVSKPTRQGLERHVAPERCGICARRLSFAIIRHGGNAMIKRKVSVVVAQHREKIGERGKRREPGSPALAMGGTVKQSVAYDLPGLHACGHRAQHRFADHQADIVRSRPS
jgi:hypothetical protein